MKILVFKVEVEEGDDEVFIFAENDQEAVYIYLTWHHDAYGNFPSCPTIKPHLRSYLRGELKTLREEMDQGKKGLSGWTADAGWHIYPPDHQLAGE